MVNSNPQEPKHCHCKTSTLITRKWEDVAALLCEQLITLMKYHNACKDQAKFIIENETMHDYILTRLSNIEGCYSCLFINGKLTTEQFKFYEEVQDRMVKVLTGIKSESVWDDIIDKIGIWSSAKLFSWYIDSFLNSDFFIQNDIRIE